MNAGGGAVVEALGQVIGDRLGALAKDIIGPLQLARIVGGVPFRMGRSFLLGGFSVGRHRFPSLRKVIEKGFLHSVYWFLKDCFKMTAAQRECDRMPHES